MIWKRHVFCIIEKWNSSTNQIPLDDNGEAIFWLNVGSQYEIPFKKVANKISTAIGFKGEIIWDNKMQDGPPRKKLDKSKINNLGWSAKTNLDKGIKLTLESFEKEVKKIKD